MGRYALGGGRGNNMGRTREGTAMREGGAVALSKHEAGGARGAEDDLTLAR